MTESPFGVDKSSIRRSALSSILTTAAVALPIFGTAYPMGSRARVARGLSLAAGGRGASDLPARKSSAANRPGGDPGKSRITKRQRPDQVEVYDPSQRASLILVSVIGHLFALPCSGPGRATSTRSTKAASPAAPRRTSLQRARYLSARSLRLCPESVSNVIIWHSFAIVV